MCIYIPREKESWNGVGISEDWKFNLKRAEFSSSFSFSDRFDRIFDQERERPFRLDPRSSLRRTTRGKRWRRYPGDVAAAFQMLYPRVIDHAPLHVYIFRSMGVRLSSNNTEYRFQPTLRTISGDQFSTDSFEFRFHLSRNFQFSIPKEYDHSIYGPLTLLELDLRRVSNYYQCSRVEYRNIKRRNSSFFDFCYFQARSTRYKDPRDKK